MQIKQSEQENLQSSTETNNKENSNLGNIDRIEDTMFSIVNDPDHGWFLAIGQNRVTEPTKTREEAIAKLETEKWDLVFKMILIVVEASKAVDEAEWRQSAVKRYTDEHPDVKVVKV